MSLLLVLALLVPGLPRTSAAEDVFEIPSDHTTYFLEGSSSNSKNQAEYFYIHHDVLYVIFSVRSDKILTSGAVSFGENGEELQLTMDTQHLYSSLVLHGETLSPHNASDKTYLWQVSHCEIESMELSEQLIISAEAGPGGFNISNVPYTLVVEYGMHVTKKLVSVNGVAASEMPTANVGDVIVWEIVVTNDGELSLQDISVSDQLPVTTLDDTEPFDLGVGESKSIFATHTVQDYEAGTTIVNVVTAETPEHLVEGGTSGELIVQSKPQTVTFHANLPGVDESVFRTYYPAGAALPEGDNFYHLTEAGTVGDPFYDIPQFDYSTHNGYIFKGWYMDPDSEENPMDWTASYTTDTDIYAHWISVEDVTQEDDGKQNIENSTYRGFDLAGTQIRTAETDPEEHYGTEGSGLRFISVLSESVWSQVLGIRPENATAAEYGMVMAKTNTAKTNNETDDATYQLQYVGSNVNGVDTREEYWYARNFKCSGVPDHFNGTGYRLFTLVVTFKNPETQAANQQVDFLARAYLRYYDVNGLLRTHYNNYAEATNVYHGCSASYNTVLALTEAALEGGV